MRTAQIIEVDSAKVLNYSDAKAKFATLKPKAGTEIWLVAKGQAPKIKRGEKKEAK